jgi:hypothetical protein
MVAEGLRLMGYSKSRECGHSGVSSPAGRAEAQTPLHFALQTNNVLLGSHRDQKLFYKH